MSKWSVLFFVFLIVVWKRIRYFSHVKRGNIDWINLTVEMRKGGMGKGWSINNGVKCF